MMTIQEGKQWLLECFFGNTLSPYKETNKSDVYSPAEHKVPVLIANDQILIFLAADGTFSYWQWHGGNGPAVHLREDALSFPPDATCNGYGWYIDCNPRNMGDWYRECGMFV